MLGVSSMWKKEPRRDRLGAVSRANESCVENGKIEKKIASFTARRSARWHRRRSCRRFGRARPTHAAVRRPALPTTGRRRARGTAGARSCRRHGAPSGAHQCSRTVLAGVCTYSRRRRRRRRDRVFRAMCSVRHSTDPTSARIRHRWERPTTFRGLLSRARARVHGHVRYRRRWTKVPRYSPRPGVWSSIAVATYSPGPGYRARGLTVPPSVAIRSAIAHVRPVEFPVECRADTPPESVHAETVAAASERKWNGQMVYTGGLLVFTAFSANVVVKNRRDRNVSVFSPPTLPTVFGVRFPAPPVCTFVPIVFSAPDLFLHGLYFPLRKCWNVLRKKKKIVFLRTRRVDTGGTFIIRHPTRFR